MENEFTVLVRDVLSMNDNASNNENSVTSYKITYSQMRKIKYFKNQHELFKTTEFYIDCSNCMFKEIINFCKNLDNIDIKVNINKEAEETKFVISDEALNFFKNWNVQSMVDLCKVLIFIEYPYLMEVACKKIADLLLETNGNVNFNMF